MLESLFILDIILPINVGHFKLKETSEKKPKAASSSTTKFAAKEVKEKIGNFIIIIEPEMLVIRNINTGTTLLLKTIIK